MAGFLICHLPAARLREPQLKESGNALDDQEKQKTAPKDRLPSDQISCCALNPCQIPSAATDGQI